MSTEKFQVYKCNVCGIIAEILHEGAGSLVCCGEKMQLMTENTVDAAVEKHVPVIEKTTEGTLIKVGEVEHPMTEEHYIEWIEVKYGPKLLRKYLKPGDKPEFLLKCDCEIECTRAYCNLHGLWKNKK